MEIIKLQKSQTLLLMARQGRIAEAQEVLRQTEALFYDTINLVADELGIKDRGNWKLSADMTELEKREAPPDPPPPPDSPAAPTAE